MVMRILALTFIGTLLFVGAAAAQATPPAPAQTAAAPATPGPDRSRARHTGGDGCGGQAADRSDPSGDRATGVQL